MQGGSRDLLSVKCASFPQCETPASGRRGQPPAGRSQGALALLLHTAGWRHPLLVLPTSSRHVSLPCQEREGDCLCLVLVKGRLAEKQGREWLPTIRKSVMNAHACTPWPEDRRDNRLQPL